MRIIDLIQILENLNPEAVVLVRHDGSIFKTDAVDEHMDYNDGSDDEFYILAVD